MFNFLSSEPVNSTPKEVARFLRLLGWLGFCLQSLLGFIPILVVVGNVLSNSGETSEGLWLAIACLVFLIFSIYWCFRYTQLANRLEEPDQRPARSQVFRDLKLGLVANLGIMILAVMIAMGKVGELTVRMLSLPKGATVIKPSEVGTMITQGAIVTSSNMITIQAMMCAIAAGLVGVIVSLLLLYLVGQKPNSQA